MPYTVGRTLRVRVAPRRTASTAISQVDVPSSVGAILLAQIDARLAAVPESLEGRSDVRREDIDRIVEDLRRLRSLVADSREPPSRSLQRETSQAISAFDHLVSTGSLPSNYGRTPWLLFGLGAAAMVGIWWWTRREQMLAELADTEDCGCDG